MEAATVNTEEATDLVFIRDISWVRARSRCAVRVPSSKGPVHRKATWKCRLCSLVPRSGHDIACCAASCELHEAREFRSPALDFDPEVSASGQTEELNEHM